MQYLKVSSLFVILSFALSCSREEVGTKDTFVESSQVALLNSRTSSVNLDPSKGHAVVSIASNLVKESVKFRSLQQPEAQLEWTDDGRLLLKGLYPQRHDFIVEAKQQDGTEGVVAFRDVEVASNSLLELGQPSFQRPGTMIGRVLSSTTNEPIGDAKVLIVELDQGVKSSNQGTFELTGLPPGRWTLAVAAQGIGVLSHSEVIVRTGSQFDIGDIWLGRVSMSTEKPKLLNGQNGIVSEAMAEVELNLPPGSRYISVKNSAGVSLLERSPARRNLSVPLTDRGESVLYFQIYDGKKSILGTLELSVIFDPFSTAGNLYVPEVEMSNRIIKSPDREINLNLKQIPQKASHVRFLIDGTPGDWQVPQETVVVTLPKSNSTCGQRTIGIQFQDSVGQSSSVKNIPVTLSCWERIPHRAAIDKIIGIDNAATWTGKHAFVWSGKQFDISRRASVWGDSNSAETVREQEALHTYSYMDTGYIFTPRLKEDGQMDRPSMEYIVTDWAPAPRTSPGTTGRNSLVAVFGGENHSGPIAEGAIFDINTNGWVSMMTEGAPSARIAPTVQFVSESKVLVWGGYTRTNLGYNLPLNDGAIYDISSHKWDSISTENVPNARMFPVTVWTGSELFVFGGVLPGNIEQFGSAKYNPVTDTWQALNQLTDGQGNPLKLTHTTAVYDENDHIVFYGRNHLFMSYRISSDEQVQLAFLGLKELRISPVIVMTEDPSDQSLMDISVFGGTRSMITTDVDERFLRLDYNRTSGTINYYQIFDGIFPSAGIGGQEISKCCVDFLGFNFDNKVFALNGSEISNTTVYTKITSSQFSDGSTNNYTDTVYTYKGHNSRFIEHLSSGSVAHSKFDLPLNITDFAPLGPYYLHKTTLPAWDAQSNKLYFYGGIFEDPYVPRYVQGGYALDVDSKSWNSLPPAPSDPSYDYGTGGIHYRSRFDSINFVKDGVLFILGGYRYNTDGTMDYVYDGLKATLTNSGASVPSLLALEPEGLSYDFLPLASRLKRQWDMNQPCRVGSNVLFTGGRRQKLRTGNLQTASLLQDKLVFDTASEELKILASDPLGVRAGATVVPLDDKCFVWGGYSADGAEFTEGNSVENNAQIRSYLENKNDGAIYSFDTDSWASSSLLGAPSARAFAHGVWSGESVYIWGGSAWTTPSVSESPDLSGGVWKYSVAENKWSMATNMENAPRYNGNESPVWTGSHIFIFKTTTSEYSYQYTPAENRWTKIAMPAGFNFGSTGVWDTHVVWTGSKLFIMPYYMRSPATMAFFIPPDP